MEELNRQKLGDRLVKEHVHYCVSVLISELAKIQNPDWEYQEDLYTIAGYKQDWESALMNEDWTEDENDCDLWHHPEHGKHAGSAEQICSEFEIEPIDCEIFEQWIVSDWLADKLKAWGEVVVKDFLGMTIWGRTTTGQAILMDRVIQEIAIQAYT